MYSQWSRDKDSGDLTSDSSRGYSFIDGLLGFCKGVDHEEHGTFLAASSSASSPERHVGGEVRLHVHVASFLKNEKRGTPLSMPMIRHFD
jgi:hypothetical protein